MQTAQAKGLDDFLDVGGKSKVGEARQMAKPWTEAEAWGGDGLSFPTGAPVIPTLSSKPKVLHFPGKWTQEEIFIPVAFWQLRSVLAQVPSTELPSWKLSK